MSESTLQKKRLVAAEFQAPASLGHLRAVLDAAKDFPDTADVNARNWFSDADVPCFGLTITAEDTP